MEQNNFLPLFEYIKNTHPSEDSLVALLKNLDLENPELMEGFCSHFTDETITQFITQLWHKDNLSELPLAFSVYKTLYAHHKYTSCLTLFKHLEYLINNYEQPLYYGNLLVLGRTHSFLHENTQLLTFRDKFKDFEALHEYVYKCSKSQKNISFANTSKLHYKIDWLITYHDKECLIKLEKKEKPERLQAAFMYLFNSNVFQVRESFFRYHFQNPDFLDYILDKNYITDSVYKSIKLKIHKKITDFAKHIISDPITSCDYYKEKMAFFDTHDLSQYWFQHNEYQNNPLSYKQTAGCREAVFIMKHYFNKNQYLSIDENNAQISLNTDENKFILKQMRKLYSWQHSQFLSLEDIESYLDSMEPANIDPTKVIKAFSDILLLKDSQITNIEKELLLLQPHLNHNIPESQKFKI